MPIHRRAWPRPEHGFGLIELMVTLVLLAAVLASLYLSFFGSQRQGTRMTKVAEMRQGARTCIQLMEREIRMAGSGWGRLTVYGSKNGASDSLAAVTPGYGGVAGSDSVQLVGAWQASTTLSSSMPNPSSILNVSSVSGFSDNDLVIITDGVSAHLFQLTGVNSSSSNLQHNPSSPYNVAGGHNQWPAGGYGVGAQVYKITRASYYYDSSSYRKPALLRREFGQAPQIVAYNVNGLHVWYELQDGTRTRSPGNLAFVDKVIPVVLTRVTDSRLAALGDSVWAVIRPRTF
ncbi:MAG: prepilin-type N-terminal cleavage/methylation domain-containing protein [Candidatus Eisenbacteria bacterium]